MSEGKKIEELEREMEKLEHDLEMIEKVNQLLAEENQDLREENTNLKAALRAVARQQREFAEEIDKAVDAIEGQGFN